MPVAREQVPLLHSTSRDGTLSTYGSCYETTVKSVMTDNGRSVTLESCRFEKLRCFIDFQCQLRMRHIYHFMFFAMIALNAMTLLSFAVCQKKMRTDKYNNALSRRFCRNQITPLANFQSNSMDHESPRFHFRSHQTSNMSPMRTKYYASEKYVQKVKKVKIAFMGNSILYYNDSPRLVQQMIMASGYEVEQDSCLRGGATLTTLWNQGNGVVRKFATHAALMKLESPTANDKQDGNDVPYLPSPVLVERLDDRYDTGAQNPQQLLLKYNKNRHQQWNSENIIRNANDGWDFLVLNDFTQGPARQRTRTQSIRTIKTKIAPSLWELSSKFTTGRETSDYASGSQKLAIPIIVQTQAYRIPGIKGSSSLGNFHSFSNLLRDGVISYANAFDQVLPSLLLAMDSEDGDDALPPMNSIARIAPVGEAYRYLYIYNRRMFNQLYCWDNKHPSPFGTYLQACVIFLACFQSTNRDAFYRTGSSDAAIAPPLYSRRWWRASRYVMPPPPLDYVESLFSRYSHGMLQLRFPTDEEASILRSVACNVSGVIC